MKKVTFEIEKVNGSIFFTLPTNLSERFLINKESMKKELLKLKK